jgi:hypothetical protein
MAENLNDIFENFGNQSLEELGSSLLSRQEAINKEQAKEAKKSRRIGQALALMGVGQKIFKNAYNKRAKEIDDLKIFEIANNSEQAGRINQMSNLLSVIPENFEVDKTLDERVELFMQSDQSDLLEQKLGGTVDNMLQQMSMFEGFNTRPEYLKTKEHLTQEAVRYFFEGNRVKQFEDELKKLYNNPEMDRMELLEKGMGLTSTALTKAETKYYDNLKQQYRNKGILQSMKDIGKKLSRRADKNGEMNLFKNIDTLDLYGSMDTALDDLNIGPKLQIELDRAIADFKGSSSDLRMKADSNQGLQETVQGMLTSIATAQNKTIKKDEILQMGPNMGKDFDYFYNGFKNDTVQVGNFVRDISTMITAFREPEGIELAVNMYKANMERIGKEITPEAIEEFRFNIATDDSFAAKFATIMVGNIGFKEINRAVRRPIRLYDSSGLVDSLDKDYTYDIFDNPLSVILDDGIKTPSESSSGSYEIDKNWNRMSNQSKTSSFDKQINVIIKSKLTDAKKQLLLENLFEEIKNPLELNFEEYMQYFNKKYSQPYQPYQSIIGT